MFGSWKTGMLRVSGASNTRTTAAVATVTIFAASVAKQRARAYYEALQMKRLPTIREAPSH